MEDKTCGCERRSYCTLHAPTCTECRRPSRTGLARGRCNSCYKRFRKAAMKDGTFVPLPRRSRPPLERLLQKVTPGPNGCWIFTGAVSKEGYGYFTISAHERALAHRVSYRMFNGEIPEGHQVDHTCHNQDPSCRSGDPCFHRRCINPSHLEAVV